MEQLTSELNAAVENFNSRGSGFVFDRVVQFTIVVSQYRPLSGSTFIPTPPSIERKNAIINVRNSDAHCFEYSILSCLYPSKNRNSHRVCSYTKHMGTLNFDGIPFPVSVKDIPKFEKQNPSISVNVTSPDPETHGFSIDYMSAERQRQHHVNLLLLHDPDSDTKHYTFIKNFSRLLGDRTKHKAASYVCNSCLNVFSSQRVLDQHVPNCLRHNPQMIVYPDPTKPDQCKLKFNDVQKQHPLAFYLVCDFEAFLIPQPDQPDTNTKSHILDEHQVSGYCCHRVTDIPEHRTEPTLYSGADVMAHFYDHVISESDKISEILSKQAPMSPMTDDDKKRHGAASTCHNLSLIHI